MKISLKGQGKKGFFAGTDQVLNLAVFMLLLIGIVLVVVMSQILSTAFNFPIFVSANILALAIAICVSIGVLAGIIPAMIAAKMDPVVAIRSK